MIESVSQLTELSKVTVSVIFDNSVRFGQKHFR